VCLADAPLFYNDVLTRFWRCLMMICDHYLSFQLC
jgi:hypothetical protein